MGVMISLGIFYTLYGILGLFGLQVIPEKYKGAEWNTMTILILLIVCSLPSLIYSFKNEQKYKAMLKE